MTALDIRGFGKLASALLLGVALAGTPALAANGNGNGGNGGGNGGSSSHAGGNGNGQSNGHGGNSHASSGSQSDDAGTDASETNDTASGSGAAASSYGNINGFLHASAKALAHASPQSEIGRVISAYGAKLQGYVGGTATLTAADLQAALQSVANKPVTADMIAAVNAKLVASEPQLAAALSTSGKTLDQINAEVSAGL